METLLVIVAILLISAAAVTSLALPKRRDISAILMSLFFIVIGFESTISSPPQWHFALVGIAGCGYFAYRYYSLRNKHE